MLAQARASRQRPTGISRQTGDDHDDAADRMARQGTLTFSALLAAAAVAVILGVATAQPQLGMWLFAGAVFIVLVAPLVEAPESAIYCPARGSGRWSTPLQTRRSAA